MFKKLLAILGISAAVGAPARAAGLHSPYAEPHLNLFYNLLFCDDLELFRTDEAMKSGAPWTTLLAAKPDYAALRKIAQDPQEESRLRALAYNRLRAGGQTVPAKVLLGVIVEVPVEQGLDVLAAYPDGRVRYLNHSGKIAVFEGGPADVVQGAKDLVATAQNLVDHIGPWDKKRLPPPRRGNVRMTFLVSDGLYFGEGPFEAVQEEKLGGPVLDKATQLLLLVVKAGTK
jgi:hypothetical protein